MISNNRLLKIFYQRRNVKLIEDMISENNENQFPKFNPDAKINWKGLSDNNPVIQSDKKANEILDNIFPFIVNTYDLNNVSKPKALIFGKGFFKDLLSKIKNNYKYELSSIVMMPFLYLLGATVPETILLSQVPYLLVNFKQYAEQKDAGGYIDPFIKSNIFVRESIEDYFVLALAHETVHSIHGQKTGKINRMSGILGRYQLYTEGIAEAISIETVQHIGNKNLTKFKHLAGLRKGKNLCSSYHDLCDKLKIPEDHRMIQKDETMPTPYYCSMHNAGYTVVELLRRERGDDIIREMVTNNFKL